LGFTLVELLIVIIIIGILAGAMLMLVGSGTDRAEATKVISDLRSMKAAALMYYADGRNDPNKDKVGPDGLGKYMDRTMKDDDYAFVSADVGWFVGRKGISAGAQKALAGDTKNITELGLLFSPKSGDVYKENEANVYMRAR